MRLLQRVEQWVRTAPPTLADAAIALVILAVAIIEWLFSYEPFPTPHKGLGLALLAVGAIGLTVRRKSLPAAFVLVAALPVVGLASNAPVLLGNGAFLMEMILLYSVAEQRGPILATLALLLQLALDFLSFRLPFHTGILALAEGDSVLIVMVWFAGRAQSRRRAVAGQLERTAKEVREERDRLARGAVAVERTRIAQELHGLVVRGVERMNARTRTAEELLADEPATAPAAIEGIEETGRATLMEMRRLLMLLRTRGEAPG